MNKETLEQYIREGMTTREIGKSVGLSGKTISYWANKYKLNDDFKYRKTKPFWFGKIDTKEKAYFIGFLACDGYVNDTTKKVEISLSIRDREVVEFLADFCDANVHIDTELDRKSRNFPNVSFTKKIPDVSTFIGVGGKAKRHLPIVSPYLNRYMLLGAFDADGCITWGRRKDRNRIWHKVSFTSSLGILTSLQNILIKELSISSTIRPKGEEKCFVLEFSNRPDVINFIDYLYQDDFVVLHRKQSKSNALRLELEENGESLKKVNTVPSPQSWEGVETTGESARILNNRDSIQGV